MHMFRTSGGRPKSDKSKGDKTKYFSRGSSTISIPEKDARGMPPHKVIRAIREFNPDASQQRSGYVSYSNGQYFHAFPCENNPNLYTVFDKHGTPGFVPVESFEEVDKHQTAQTVAGQTPAADNMTAHDSGFSENSNGGFGGNNNRSTQQSGPSPDPQVYAVVQYDFKAERADEFEAKAGESIIIVALSNPEWFVVKPISRNGGPGLFPVSFVEVRDKKTGAIAADPLETVRQAGVPRVEEWKRKNREHKNNCIPLGKFGSDAQSINSARQSQATQYHQRAASQAQSMRPPQERRSHPPSSIRARVPYFYFDNRIDEDKQRVYGYMFVVEAQLEDRTHWRLFKRYDDFFRLQIGFKNIFPELALQGADRILPFIPGPVHEVTEKIADRRRKDLDEYLVNLIDICPEVLTSQPAEEFFTPRPAQGDVQIENQQDSPDIDYRHSGTSSRSSANQYSHTSSAGNHSTSTTPTSYNNSPSRQHVQPTQNEYTTTHTQRNTLSNGYHHQPDVRNSSGNKSSSSTLNAPPPMLRNNSAMTSVSALSGQSQSSGPAVKVKVWFGNTNCIIIRLPMGFSYQDLLAKLQERWESNEAANNHVTPQSPFQIAWRDEDRGDHHSLENDGDLNTARNSCEKLTLRVQPA